MRQRRRAAGSHNGWTVWTALLASGACACGSTPAMTVAAIDMSPFASARGVVGGETPAIDGATFANDDTCGPRGVKVTLVEDGAGCVTNDAGSGRTISIYFSDFLPGVYTEADALSCQSFPGGKGFYAAFHGTTGDYDSLSGAVTLGYYSQTTLGADYDIHFSLRAGGGAVDNGELSGSFYAEQCQP